MRTQEKSEAGADTTQQNFNSFNDTTIGRPPPAIIAALPHDASQVDVNFPSKEIYSSDSSHNDSKTPSFSEPVQLLNEDEVIYPEGGLKAWLVVLGSWCGMLAGLGLANTIASFQSYILENQLKGYDAGTVGWIFSVYAFLAFAAGLVIGPLFDKYGPKWLITAGCVFLCATLFLLGECTQYWHFMLVFGVLGGLGTSLMFTPSIAAVGHWFNRKRGNATGIAATGGAIGGVIFPLTLESLIPKIGFAWSCRVLGFIYIALSIVAILLIRSRLPPRVDANAKPDFRILRSPAFAITVGGVFLIEWALFIPLTYISSYALHEGFSTSFSYHILVYLNVGSIFGRWLPGFYADIIGRFNCAIIAIATTVISVLVIWLPFGHTEAGLIIFAVLFGFASGSNISLTPVCVGQLCETQEYGRYYATCYTIVSVGCLTGIPIVGEILNVNSGEYWGLTLFVGMCYVGALLTFIAARILETGWRLKAKY